ncbi:hypothetical protein K7432_009410 [Basidiobolus ranarum]|uniref:Major facilitator superfamily (MFS) profile domain-containing protein n=1 Tax=Basidiobolus ranarum TaxID=34480 RepID=A0ABR2VX34_9FUNG
MSDLHKNNEKAMSDGTAEAIHAETPEEIIQNKANFKNFFIGYVGLLFADLMTGYIMYSDFPLMPTYTTEFKALPTFALLGTCNSLIQAIAPPLVANSGEIFGFKRIYFLSLFLFILGCVLNGLSTNWNMFVAASSIRTLGTQGLNISGAILIATGLPLRKRGLWSSFQNIF